MLPAWHIGVGRKQMVFRVWLLFCSILFRGFRAMSSAHEYCLISRYLGKVVYACLIQYETGSLPFAPCPALLLWF